MEFSHGTQTVARALRLLTFIVGSERPVRVGELSKLSGIERSATYRLLRELERHEFLARDATDLSYVPGTELLRMAAVLVGRASVRDQSREIMVALRDATRETVSLHVRSGLQRVCLESVEGSQPIRRVVPLGETLPLTAGVSGKAILAFLPDAEQAKILEQLEASGATIRKTRQQLDDVRRDGYLAAEGDRVVGVGGLSVPVFGPAGVVASITVSGPSNRWTLEKMQSESGRVVRLVGKLSAQLGGQASRASPAGATRVVDSSP